MHAGRFLTRGVPRLARRAADIGAAYAFTDNAVMPSVTYYYKLEYVDVYGVSTFHGPTSAAPF